MVSKLSCEPHEQRVHHKLLCLLLLGAVFVGAVHAVAEVAKLADDFRMDEHAL